MDPQGLDVHDVTSKQVPIVNRQTGQMMMAYQVTYSIGAHGPFTDTYPPGTYTKDAVVANIQRQIQILRQVANPQSYT